MVGPVVGGRRCAAPPLSGGGNFSVLLLGRKVKTGRSLFLPLFRTLGSTNGIQGDTKESETSRGRKVVIRRDDFRGNARGA